MFLYLQCHKKILEAKFGYEGKNVIKGYYITANSTISQYEDIATEDEINVFATKKQAKSALAMAQISQYMANDKRYGGIVTDEEWNCNSIVKYVIIRIEDGLGWCMRNGEYAFLAFHTPEQRELFLKEHKDLVKDYLMID